MNELIMKMRFLIIFLLTAFSTLAATEEASQCVGKMNCIVFVDDEGKIVKEGNEPGIQWVGLKLPGTRWARSGLEDDLRNRFLERELTLQDIEDLKYRVILYYKEKGSSLVRVMVPEQDVTDGILHIIVKETRVGKVETKGNDWSSARFTRNTVGLKSGDKIDVNEINTDLAFLNRNPFKNTDVIFTPGQAANTTDIELITVEEKPARVYAGVDNRGNEAIGNYRQFEGFYCGDFLGLDHVFSYQFTTSLPLKRMHAHAVYYEIPLPYRMSLVGFGGYSSIHTKDFSTFMDNKGINVQVSGRYHFPMFPWGKAVNDFSFGFDYKRTNNNVLFSEIPIVAKTATLSQFVLGYQFQDTRRDGWGLFNFELFVSPAKWFTNQNKQDYQLLSPGALPRYFYFLTSWKKEFQLPHCMRIGLRLKGQYANQNLLPSEQFGLGGFDTVRGYREREINGDNGFLGNLEFKAPLISLFKGKILCNDDANLNTINAKDALLLLAFVDYGFVNRHKKVPGADNTQYIVSVGPGLEYAISPYFQAAVYWGIRLKSTQFSSAPGGRINFSVVASF